MNQSSPHEPNHLPPAGRPRFRAIWILPPFVVILVAIAAASFFQRPVTVTPAIPATVEVSKPLVREVRQWDAYVGRFAASKLVEVRPRVGGAIVGVHFRDGAIVKAGQLLFTVDPRPYRAALTEARAAVASARSRLALARSDYERASRLTGDDAVSAREVDALRSKLEDAAAALAAASSRADARALDVEFTQVRAPITGRISDRRVDAGNLVAGGDGAAATLLTTINALDPIYFVFDAPEDLYLKSQADGASGNRDVEIRLQNESAYRWRGKLDFTDNGIDPRSGTVRGRAILPNPALKLIPGLFGDMRMADAGTARALLVPDTAIQSDQADKAVLVVAANGIVEQRKVTLGPVVDGLRIIVSGLRPDERVIIGGNMAATPGARVEAKAGRIVPRRDHAAAPDQRAASAATVVSN